MKYSYFNNNKAHWRKNQGTQLTKIDAILKEGWDLNRPQSKDSLPIPPQKRNENQSIKFDGLDTNVFFPTGGGELKKEIRKKNLTESLEILAEYGIEGNSAILIISSINEEMGGAR